MSRPLRVLIVDDEPLARVRLRALLQQLPPPGCGLEGLPQPPAVIFVTAHQPPVPNVSRRQVAAVKAALAEQG